MLKKVDLPQPVFPTMATISPRGTVKSRRSMATTATPDPFCRKTLRSHARIDVRASPAPGAAGTRAGGVTRATPAGVVEARHPDVGHHEDDHQHDRPGKDVGHREVSLACMSGIADAGGGPYQLGHGRHPDGQAQVYLPAREDGGHRGREDELGEELAGGGAESAHGRSRRLLAHPVHAVQYVDDEDGRAHHHQNEGDAHLAHLEPEHGEEDPARHRAPPSAA